MTTKYKALDSLNQLVLGGVKKTREQWQRWGEKNFKFLPGEKAVGFRVVVGVFQCPDKGEYVRVNAGGQPAEIRRRINGSVV